MKLLGRLTAWSVRLIMLPMAQTSQIEDRLTAILKGNRRRTMITRKMLTVALLATATIVVPLAALRPAAQAMADGPSESAPTVPPLTGGVKVDLAGMTEASDTTQSLTKHWWGPTGDALPRPLRRTSDHQFRPLGQTPAQDRVLAFQVSSPDGQPVTTVFRPAQCLTSSSDGGWIGKIADPAQATEAQIASLTGGYRMLYCAYPAGVTKTDVRVGVGAGSWTTSASSTNASTGSMTTALGNPCIFSSLTSTEGGSQVTISLGDKAGNSITDVSDLRVVAVDADGHERLPVSIGDNSSGALDQIQARFALPPTAIKAIRLQTRPFQWVQFHNVPLQPR